MWHFHMNTIQFHLSALLTLPCWKETQLCQTQCNPPPSGISNADTLAGEMDADSHRHVYHIPRVLWLQVSALRRIYGISVDTFVAPATSALYAAYQKLAARIFPVSTQPRCTFISILKLYVTDSACVAKWRQLKHNDYETIIIWRSTRGGPRPKCSLRAVYKGPRKSSRTNLQKKLLLSPSLSRLVSPPIFIVSPRDNRNAQKAQRMFNCLWNLNGEITQLLKPPHLHHQPHPNAFVPAHSFCFARSSSSSSSLPSSRNL